MNVNCNFTDWVEEYGCEAVILVEFVLICEMCQNKRQEGRKNSILPLWFWETDTKPVYYWKICNVELHCSCWKRKWRHIVYVCHRIEKKNTPLTNTVESWGAIFNSISVFLFHLPRLIGFSLTLLVGLLPNLKGDISGEREGHWKNKKSVSYGQIVNVCICSLTHTLLAVKAALPSLDHAGH